MTRPRDFPLLIPVVVVLYLAQTNAGLSQALATSVAVIPTIAAVYLGAHFVWSLLLKRRGIWWPSGLLLGALVTVGFAAAVARVKFGDTSGYIELSMKAAMAALLFGWAVAALRQAQEKRLPGTPAGPAAPASRLVRGRWRASR